MKYAEHSLINPSNWNPLNTMIQGAEPGMSCLWNSLFGEVLSNSSVRT